MNKPTYTTPEDELFFASIGRLTISWAILELGLDYIIRMLHEDLSGKNIHPDRPWALNKKLEYMRRCFRAIDLLKNYSEKADSFSKSITEEATLRHDMIHGVATNHPEGATTVQMVRIMRGGSNPDTLRHFSVSAIDILKSAKRVNALQGVALELSADLRDAISSNQRH
jgi:hypothetical protein